MKVIVLDVKDWVGNVWNARKVIPVTSARDIVKKIARSVTMKLRHV